MKTFKKIGIGILTIIAVFAMASCDLSSLTSTIEDTIENVIEETVWPYSDNGETEINSNFEAILSDTYSGVFEWTVTATENGSSSSFNLKYYADKSGETKKYKYVYEKDETKLTLIKIGSTTSYYINDTAKTVSTVSSDEFDVFLPAMLAASYYGTVKFTDTDSQPTWTFVSKTDSKTVINASGVEEDTVEYNYTSIEEATSDSSTHLYVNFRKIATPVIARIYSEVYNDGVLSKTYTVYITLHTGETVTESTFVAPTIDNGYTVVD